MANEISETEIKELKQIIKATMFTSKENIISLLIILPTILFHLIFTSILHLG